MKYIVSYDYKHREWWKYGTVEVEAMSAEEAIEKACKEARLRREEFWLTAKTEAEREADRMWDKKHEEESSENLHDRLFVEAWLESDGETKEEAINASWEEYNALKEELEELNSIKRELNFLIRMNEERSDELKMNLERLTKNYRLFKK